MSSTQSREEVAQELVRRAVRARQWMEDAREQYHEALTDALDARVSYTRLAREMGVTEAAVRMYRKRHDL